MGVRSSYFKVMLSSGERRKEFDYGMIHTHTQKHISPHSREFWL